MLFFAFVPILYGAVERKRKLVMIMLVAVIISGIAAYRADIDRAKIEARIKAYDVGYDEGRDKTAMIGL